MARKTIVSMQIRASEDLRDRAKEIAKKQGLTLSELVLKLLGTLNDKELKSLVKEELQERRKPGRPWDK